MTATEELRRLLDEHGVEWEDCGNGATYVEYKGCAWQFDYDEIFNQLVIVCLSGYTPEQAIAATLGAGTCKADETDVIKCWVKCKDEPSVERMELIHVMECSACGGTYEYVNGGYEFCPRCGAKVVDE